MRFNFSKISAVLASAIMIGSSAGIAAAANYPSPFVSGGTADVAIVYGTGAGVSALDSVEAGFISTDLQSRMSGGGTTVQTSCSGGDCYLIQLASTNLNFNDALTTVKSSAIDDSELPNLLSDGTYISGDGKSYGFTQKINLYPNLKFLSFTDNDYKDKTPALGIKVNKNVRVHNYSITWKKQPLSKVDSAKRLADLEDSDLSILGKTYTILNAYNASENSGRAKLELMGGAFLGTVNAGEVTTATLQGSTYVVRASDITSSTNADVCIAIDGGAEKCYDNLNAGETRELANAVQLGIRDIDYHSKTGTIDNVDFSLGAQKLTLEANQTVELNDVDIDGVTVTINQVPSGAKQQLGNIVFSWQAKEEYFIADDNSASIPGLGRIKLASGGFFRPTNEIIKVNPDSSQSAILEIPIKDGVAKVPLLWSTNGTQWNAIGSFIDEWLATTNSSTLAWNGTRSFGAGTSSDMADEYFVASWNSSTDAESYLLTVTEIKDDKVNTTVIKNLVSGDVQEAKSGADIKFGNVELTTAVAIADDDSVNLTINAGGSFDRIYSKEGIVFYLPKVVNHSSVVGTSSMQRGAINITKYGQNGTVGTLRDNNVGTDMDKNDTVWILWGYEEDKDGNLGMGQLINFTLGFSGEKSRVSNIRTNWSSDGVTTNDPDLETEQESNIYVDWVTSDLGTKITMDKPTGSGSQFSAELEYHGGETYGLIYIADENADISKVGTTTSTTTVAQIGEVLVKDSQVSSVASKNLIIVGGTCINSAAATALKVSAGTCGSAFTDATGVGAGQFLIQSVGDAFASGKVALVVAGYNVDDTGNAAKFLRTKTVDTTAGSKYKGTTATDAAMVVA